MTINVIKIGGNIINDSVALSSFLKDFAKLKGPSFPKFPALVR
ncbi:hypothetical protein SAMN06298216_0914 [Spirosomataceae bacterium TFI 002]|nr:hypothetical protein SAMN06298216_0914 [Spirosomataceae bacterium TFI 002]